MFGKPHWFREKQLGWGLVPIRWQGWAYTAAWAAAIGLPFILLVDRHQGLEAIVWMAASLGVLVWDVREILKAMRAVPQEEPMYIGPEDDSDDASWLGRTTA